MAQSLRIGALADLTGTNVETIRYYERLGLLPAPARTAGNYRSYEPSHVGRLSFIRRARDLGFSLDQVRDLLDLADQKERSCESVDTLAREHLAEVERKIADLKGLRRELDSLISQCRHGTIAECRILEALAPKRRAMRSERPGRRGRSHQQGAQRPTTGRLHDSVLAPRRRGSTRLSDLRCLTRNMPLMTGGTSQRR